MTGVLGTDVDISVRLPDGWFEFDLWRATRTGDLARAVDERVAEFPALAELRGPMLRFLRQVAIDAERRGTVFAAAMLEADGDDLIVATAMAFLTPGPDDENLADVETIASELTAVAPAENTDHWRTVGIIDIPAGRCVRVRGIESASLGDGAITDCVAMHSLIPVPEIGQVLDFVLVSPHTWLSDGILSLFDAISSTLHWGGPSGSSPSMATDQ